MMQSMLDLWPMDWTMPSHYSDSSKDPLITQFVQKKKSNRDFKLKVKYSGACMDGGVAGSQWV